MFSSRSYSCFWWPSGALLGCFLGSLGRPFGLSWASWAAFCAFLGLSWTHLGPFWDLLGLIILAPPMPLQAYLGPPLAYLCSWWPSVAHLGFLSSSLGPLSGSLLSSFGPFLGPFWPSCSFPLALQKAIFGPLGLSSASQASRRVFSYLALHL